MSTPILTAPTVLDRLPKPKTEQEYMERIELIRALIEQQKERMDERETASKLRWERMDRIAERTQSTLDSLLEKIRAEQ